MLILFTRGVTFGSNQIQMYQGRSKKASPVGSYRLPTPEHMLEERVQEQRRLETAGAELECHRAIFHVHFSTVFSTLSPTHSFTSFTFLLLSLFSTLLSRYRLVIRLTTLMNAYDLMTIPFILFLFFPYTLSFDEMRT